MNASLPWSLFLALIFVAGLGLSAQDQPGESKPSDRELRESLNRGSDDLDRELFGPQEKGAKPKAVPSKMPPGKDDSKQPASEAGNVSAAEAGNPLMTISRQMREAERLIARSDTGPKTQELQERILVQLQELLQKKVQRSAPADSVRQNPTSQRKGPTSGNRSRAKRNEPTRRSALPRAKNRSPRRASGLPRTSRSNPAWTR